MNLPVRLIKFYYPEALNIFLISWKNLMSLLEEDLAVGLMLKLLFVPLFHDSSFVGKGLSFVFRSLRIFIWLLSFAFLTVFVFLTALIWFISPVGFLFSVIFTFLSNNSIWGFFLLIFGL